MVVNVLQLVPQVWYFNDQAQRWEQEPAPMTGGHSDWVRDVAWAPSLGLPFHTIASAGQVCAACPCHPSTL